MPPRKLHSSSSGEPVELGPQLASGGEGAIFTLPAAPALVAKVYHRPPAGDKAEKLRCMVREASADLGKFAAWPTATLHENPGGPVVGFLMPRFNGYRAIHTLYSPAHRRASFPHADWAFLVHTARNCAIAFDAIHARNTVIGDVNQSNVLVTERALAGLIDCDSFQVQANGRLFLCEVGVGPYTPSELQGQNFRNVIRTPNHDRFGLAVLIFHLLFMGRHPFAGRYLGSGEMPLEQAIAQFRFVYARSAAALQMAPPPGVLSLQVLSPELADLFEKAFTRGAEVDNNRPTAAAWETALAAFEKGLRSCPADAGHKIPAHQVECPWCALMKQGAPDFFLGVAVGGLVFAIDTAFLSQVSARLERIALRKFAAPSIALPAGQAVAPTSTARKVKLFRQVLEFGAGIGVLLILGSCVGWWWSWWLWFAFLGAGFGLILVMNVLRRSPVFSEEARRKQALQAARDEFNAALAEWQQVTAHYRAEFPKFRERLKKARAQYEKLQVQFEAERPQQEKNKEAYFRDQFLRTCFISDHDIEKIGPSRKAMLASYGIETAYDLAPERIRAIRGMGEVLTGNLMAWKEKMTGQFKFDPQATVPESEVRTVVLKYKQMEEGLRRQLQKGVTDLEALGGQTEEQLQSIQQRIATLIAQAAQAEVDLKVLAP